MTIATSRPVRRRMPLALCAAVAVLAGVWLVLAVVVAFTGPQPVAAVRWWLLASEICAASLLGAASYVGTRPRPGQPTGIRALVAAILAGAGVVAVAVAAAAAGKANAVNTSGQIMYATAVAIAFFAVVRSRPTGN